MDTGTLTPRSNDTVEAMRFSGGFDHPDGFASVLIVRINRAGDACLTLQYRTDHLSGKEMIWSVMLDDGQRNALAAMLGRYQPRTYERFDDDAEKEKL